jgi:hypothetical protein
MEFLDISSTKTTGVFSSIFLHKKIRETRKLKSTQEQHFYNRKMRVENQVKMKRLELMLRNRD